MATLATPITLSGSYGEGGSALLRAALTMAALTVTPVRIHGVRGASRKPGLTAEDLTFARAVEMSCGGMLEGDELASNDITFRPQRAPKALFTRLDIQEHEKGMQPGSAIILAQSLLPILARTGSYSKVLTTGETYNNNALTYDAWERVSLAAHRRQGLYAFPNLDTAGFGFAGQGEVTMEVEPSVIEPIEWHKRGQLRGSFARIVYSEIPESVAERAATTLKEIFAPGGPPAEIEVEAIQARSAGIYITVWAEFENGFGVGGSMGSRGVRAEKIALEAVQNFEEWFRTESCVDPYLADQLLIPAILAEGSSVWTTSRVTSRLLTIAWVIKQFLPIHITILGRDGEPGTIKVSR